MPQAISAWRVAVSSLTLLTEGLLRIGLTALVSFWIARELGPALYGMLNFASALMGVFLTLSALGMEVPGVWRLATRGRREGSLLATMLLLRMVAAVLALALAVAAALLLRQGDPQARAVCLIVALAVLGYAPSVFDFWFKAHVEAGAPALARLLTTLLASAAKVACLAWGAGVIALAWTVVLEAVLSGALIWLAWRRRAHGRISDPLRPDRRVARTLMRDSAPYLASNLAGMLATRIDLLLLGYLATHAQTGLYSEVSPPAMTGAISAAATAPGAPQRGIIARFSARLMTAPTIAMAGAWRCNPWVASQRWRAAPSAAATQVHTCHCCSGTASAYAAPKTRPIKGPASKLPPSADSSAVATARSNSNWPCAGSGPAALPSTRRARVG